MDNDVESAINEMIERQTVEPNLRIEARIGQFLPKQAETLEDMNDIFACKLGLIDNKISKQAYRFEACISQQEFERAQHKYKVSEKQVFTLDLAVDVTFEHKNTYRFGVDENEKFYCVERSKQLQGKHLDIVDEMRQYRVSQSQYDELKFNGDQQQMLQKIKSDYQMKNDISCVRYKETIIQDVDECCQIFVFRVQQVNKKQQEFLREIYQAITNPNQSLSKNTEKAILLLQARKNYFKCFYEAEIHFNKLLKCDQYLDKVREFHDTIRVDKLQPNMYGVKIQKNDSHGKGRGKQSIQRGQQRKY